MIDVAVFGAAGRMGQRVVQAVGAASDMRLVAGIDAGEDRSAALAAAVMVDFTCPDAVMGNVEWALTHGMHVVVGTTGMTPERLDAVRGLLASDGRLGAVVASNFSIAAVLMMRFAAAAAPYFESVEIVELHHPRKADAPSGTAITTAGAIAEARRRAGCAPMPDVTRTGLDGARGAVVDGVHVHSVRSQGLFAHQEVILGNPGEQLTIRDDSFDPSSYIPGVLAAIRHVVAHPGLTLGMDALLG
ncbi:MAG: 4-hydroxy-tetrahydrodipicolinate reductase [Actinomycetia bacterium]|nr:4-hydroxy-tetrahydrodipicolinate reductase [Actinomycetes bacterium]